MSATATEWGWWREAMVTRLVDLEVGSRRALEIIGLFCGGCDISF